MKRRIVQLGYLIFLIQGVILVSSFSRSKDASPFATEHIQQITIQTDSSGIDFYQVNDDFRMPLFYYMDVDQYPCDDSVCARMQLRIYWDIWGNFLKLGFAEGQELTKIGHEPFTDKDYNRLHKLLNNPKSGIQYYELDDLTAKQSEDEYYSVDGISGATITNVTYDSVKGAVKTCHTLWRLVHGDIVDEIIRKTSENFFSESGADVEFQNQQNFLKLGNDQQIEMMGRMILSEKKPTSDFLQLASSQLESRNPNYLFCLLQLTRISTNIDGDFQKKLASFISDKFDLSEAAIYNYLLQSNYKDKVIRKYQLSKEYL